MKITPLIPITSKSIDSKFSLTTVLFKTLLKHSEMISRDTYKIDKLEQIFDGFKSAENIFILGHDVSADFPAHMHNYYEIIYVCQGNIENVIDGNSLYMSAGDMTILNPYAIHEIKYTTPDTLLVNICIKKALFNDTLKSFYEDDNFISKFFRSEISHKINYMFFSLGGNLNTQTIISAMIQEYADSDYHQTFALDAYTLLLFTQLIKSDSYSYYGIDEQTLKIIKHIETHCFHETLGEMASKLGYNPNYLTTYIKKHTGKNCSTIIQEARLTKAINLLETTDMTVYNIAGECGYNSVSHFFRIFKENYEMTPNEYRKSILRL